MIELTNPELRVRDIRKLVEPNLYKVSWDSGFEEGNEWVCMDASKNSNWLRTKSINESNVVICIDKHWAKISKIKYEELLLRFHELTLEGFSLFVSNNRDWVLECSDSVGVARFGYWR